MEEDAEIHYRLGMVFQQQGLPANAIAAYRQALALDSTLQEPRFNLGSLYARQGRYQKAIAEYQQFIEHFPEHPEARYSLGNVFLKIQNYGDALAQYEQLLAEEDAEVDKVDIPGIGGLYLCAVGTIGTGHSSLRGSAPEQAGFPQRPLPVGTRVRGAANVCGSRAGIRPDPRARFDPCRSSLPPSAFRPAQKRARPRARHICSASSPTIRTTSRGAGSSRRNTLSSTEGLKRWKQLETILELEPTHIQANWLAGHLTYNS